MRILEETLQITKNSNFVNINSYKIEEFCNLHKEVSISQSFILNYKFEKDINNIEFLFIFSCVNFCFWNTPDWEITTSSGEKYSRTTAMMESILTLYKKNPENSTAETLMNLTMEQFLSALNGATNLLLVKERFNFLHEAGKILQNTFNGYFSNFLKKYGFDTQVLLEKLVSEFPFFNDSAEYNGTKVNFQKRAQALLAYISYMKLEKYTIFNTESLTVLADYRIPQALRYFGILEYSEELANRIDSEGLIEPFSQEETEIRANSIQATEIMKINYRNIGINLSALKIDSYLWALTKSKGDKMKPHHRTITTNY